MGGVLSSTGGSASERRPEEGGLWRSGRRRKIEEDEADRLLEIGEAVKISPYDSVYSYLMFMLPMEHERADGKMTWRCIMAVLLVFFTLLIKAILLYAIFFAVVAQDERWRNTILQPKHPPFSLSAPPKCSDGKSMCSYANGTYTCAPPTIQLLGRWDELDVNGDGVWTREEAIQMKEPLMCTYVVDPLEVFNVMITFIKSREKHIWLHPDLKKGKGIHKAYFMFASGDLIMCGYRNERMCANLMQRGVFDAPLKDGTSPRVGNTIDSALDYCRALLERGGTCERYLPSTYTAWKYISEKQCWASEYERFVYKHPNPAPDVLETEKSLLAVDYKARRAYDRGSQSWLFITYKSAIIGLFLLAMYNEWKAVMLQIHFCTKYPGPADVPEGVEIKYNIDSETGKKSIKIQCVSDGHRRIIALVAVLRVAMVCVLIWVGCQFLLRDTSYVELLLNGVAMVFIMEVANQMFTNILDNYIQEQFLNMDPVHVDTGGFECLNRHIALRDMVYFFALIFVVGCIMAYHSYDVAVPIAEAVDCACLSEGPKCREATLFDKSYWDEYWSEEVPRVFKTVDELKEAEMEGKPESAVAVKAAPSPAAVKVKHAPVAPAPSPSTAQPQPVAEEKADPVTLQADEVIERHKATKQRWEQRNRAASSARANSPKMLNRHPRHGHLKQGV